MPYAEFRISNIVSAESAKARLGGRFAVDGKDLVFRSALERSCPLNDHLVWLWGQLKSDRRVLKKMKEEGAVLVCVGMAEPSSVRVLPNGAEMLHLLEAEFVVEAKDG